MKNKKYMVILIDSGKALITRALSKEGIEGTYLYIIKAIYDKSTASIVLSEEKTRQLESRRRIPKYRRLHRKKKKKF